MKWGAADKLEWSGNYVRGDKDNKCYVVLQAKWNGVNWSIDGDDVSGK